MASHRGLIAMPPFWVVSHQTQGGPNFFELTAVRSTFIAMQRPCQIVVRHCNGALPVSLRRSFTQFNRDPKDTVEKSFRADQDGMARGLSRQLEYEVLEFFGGVRRGARVPARTRAPRWTSLETSADADIQECPLGRG
jgi:hypothetical protein